MSTDNTQLPSDPQMDTLQVEQSPAQKRSSLLFYLLVIVLLTVAGTLAWYTRDQIPLPRWITSKMPVDTPPPSPLPTLSPTPSPTPIALHAGRGEYTVSHPKSSGPTIFKVLFDPLDVKKDQSITLSVLLLSDSPLSTVTGKFSMDSSETELNFTKTRMEGPYQVYSTQFSLTDTLWYTYIVSVTATNATGNTSVTVAPRS